MLFAILRILPRRSFELSFFGVEDDTCFLLGIVPGGLVLDDDDDGEDFGIVVVSSFFRLGVDDVESK
jgi:hypothetical protein